MTRASRGRWLVSWPRTGGLGGSAVCRMVRRGAPDRHPRTGLGPRPSFRQHDTWWVAARRAPVVEAMSSRFDEGASASDSSIPPRYAFDGQIAGLPRRGGRHDFCLRRHRAGGWQPGDKTIASASSRQSTGFQHAQVRDLRRQVSFPARRLGRLNRICRAGPEFIENEMLNSAIGLDLRHPHGHREEERTC